MERDVALIILYNNKKEILLQHRAKNAKYLPNYIAFFGGGIEKDETPLQEVKRETLEELEYKLENPKLVLTKKTNYETVETYKGTKCYFIE